MKSADQFTASDKRKYNSGYWIRGRTGQLSEDVQCGCPGGTHETQCCACGVKDHCCEEHKRFREGRV